MFHVIPHLGSILSPGVAPVVFNRPQWLLLLIPVTLVLIWIGRKSLSGMGTRLRRIALACRVLVAALLLAAVAEPQWTKEAEAVAVTAVVDVSRSQPGDTIGKTREFLAKAAGNARSIDLVGMVTAGREAYVQQLPRSVRSSESLEATDIGATDGTNLESAVRIALASMPPNAANRLLLVSDGNENIGSVMQAAKAAKAAGVPIDVLPIRYTNNAEVLVERLIAPSVSRQGENARLRAVLTATRAARGLLTILMNGEPIDLNGDGPGVAKAVELEAGVNVQEALVRLPRQAGPVRFEAVFEASPGADGKSGDTLTENNRAISVTFVSGVGRALVMTNKPEEASQLVNALRESRIETEVRSTSEGPPSLAELGSYECVVLVNTERFDFSERQQEELKSYINDLGGGLIMVGGDQSFGAGGWIGSSLAEALPIKLDPPQKREMPRGALVLVMHSCEMPNGNYWGRRTGEAAITSLSAKDMIGIIEYNWQGGDNWVHPITEVGDKASALRSINSLTYGDAPSFDTMLTDAYQGLKKAAAGQKHIIIISDGDPQQNDQNLINNFVAAKISVSTVAVYPHTYGNASADLNRMRRIARLTGGRYYEITNATGGLNNLPEIFIKEARTIKRSLIQESEPFSPTLAYMSEAMRGISTPVPPITGYVVGADREGLSQVVLRGKENDPILAQWQYGLGRVVTYTSDATGKWSKAWIGWPQYRAFWEQHVRWVMRPVGSPNIRVVTEDRGEMTAVVVEALDEQGERLNFLRWQGRIVKPDLAASGVDLRQVAPGRYEALVPTAQSGAYTLNMGYQSNVDGKSIRGSVQAAITRPFSDEFRSLRDNESLLRQVAEETGGQVLTFDDSTKSERSPWRRAGVTLPVSLQPIFMTVAMIALGMLLVDVAIRRVRIDVRAIGAGVVAMLTPKAKVKAGEQIMGLKAARDKARDKIDAQSGMPPSGNPGDALSLAQAASGYASTKFDASAADIASAKGQSVIDAPRPDEPRRVAAEAEKAKGTPDDEGMSRLLKAKKRAQEERGE